MHAENLIANAQTTIGKSADKVWEALTDPKMIKEYMFGANVDSDWKKGSQITWKGEMNGKKYEDKGEVLEVIPKKILKYTHFSPLSGLPDKSENYHTVTIELEENQKKTHLSLSQDMNKTEKEKNESEKNWNSMMESLKKLVEKGQS
jgi:uncharacterized protein YndB with AHSA1/START domain